MRDSREAARPAVVMLAAAAVLAQIAYPLTDGETRRLITIAAVVLFAAASIGHAATSRGVSAAVALVVIAVGGGLVVEAVGVRTGFPFGEYRYEGTLGWTVFGVPAVVPLAWSMMAWPCLLAGRVLATQLRTFGGRMSLYDVHAPKVVGGGVIGGVALASWDLFLDPQMVDEGHWSWAPSPWPDVLDIPLSNFVGWLGVAIVMLLLLDRVVPRVAADDRVPIALLGWTYFSQVLGQAVFFGRADVAVVGGVAMGLVIVPWALALRSGAVA